MKEIESFLISETYYKFLPKAALLARPCSLNHICWIIWQKITVDATLTKYTSLVQKVISIFSLFFTYATKDNDIVMYLFVIFIRFFRLTFVTDHGTY